MNGSRNAITNMVVHNETSLNLNRCKSELGPIEIWIAAVAAIVVVIACLVWVISRHVNDTKQQDETGYQFGQTIFVASKSHFIIPSMCSSHFVFVMSSCREKLTRRRLHSEGDARWSLIIILSTPVVSHTLIGCCHFVCFCCLSACFPVNHFLCRWSFKLICQILPYLS